MQVLLSLTPISSVKCKLVILYVTVIPLAKSSLGAINGKSLFLWVHFSYANSWHMV